MEYSTKQYEKLFQKKPRVWYFTSSDMIHPAPGYARTVGKAVHSSMHADSETVELSSPDTNEMMIYFKDIARAKLYKRLYKNMYYGVYDYIVNDMTSAVTVYTLPFFIKNLIINPIMTLITRTTPAISNKINAGLIFRDQFTGNYLKQVNSLVIDTIVGTIRDGKTHTNQIGPETRL